jgi:rubrerythrin
METERVIGYLKALHAIELFASETYPQYAQQTTDPEIKKTLTEFGRDSDRHRQIVVNLIADLGGRPSTVGELGTMALAWGLGLTTTGRRGAFGDFQNLQDLLFAEYRARFHWYVLRAVADVTGDQRIAGAVAGALPDEEKHVSYLEGKTRDLARESLGQV